MARFWFRAQRALMLTVIAAAGVGGVMLGEILAKHIGLTRRPLPLRVGIAIVAGSTCVRAFLVFRKR
jgi:hypothetical protein